jgi:hypothetical protein
MAGARCQNVAVGVQLEPAAQRRRMTGWITAAAATCGALGGWAGSHVGDGHVGMIALIGATCGVLGSFLPGGLLRITGRVRRSPARQRREAS